MAAGLLFWILILAQIALVAHETHRTKKLVARDVIVIVLLALLAWKPFGGVIQ